MSDSTPLALLQADQRQRWQRGEPLPVEAYLDRHPVLREDPEALLDLIYNEMMLRQESGPAPQFAEYRGRFPHLEEQIRLLFEVHEVLEVEPLDKTNIVPDPAVLLSDARPRESADGAPSVPGYEILGELGRGGMGVVYKARQVSLNRAVALKMILAGAHAGPTQQARFHTEAEAVARLQHPNIVQIYEIAEQDGRPWFSLELVEGGSLADRLARAPQPPRRAAELVQTLARAMHYAHQRGIVHRDLKPSNVLLTADGTPKVTDFGLAKLLDSAGGQTPTDAFLGTPNYMAPEQALGQSKDIGPAADVYSLGAILYESLTGRPPFQGTTVLDTLEQVRHQEPVPPSRLQPKVPRDLETICLKCLEKDAHRRYGSAEALAEDLRRFLDGLPISARPATLSRRAVKWARRRPAVATLLAVAGLLLVGAVATFAWSRLRLAELRAEIQQGTQAGERAFAAGDWAEAQTRLAAVLARIGDEPALEDLRGPVEALHAQAHRRLAEREARAHADRVHQTFVRLRDNAFFHGMDSLARGRLSAGMDRAANREAAERAARAALAEIGLDLNHDKPWSPDPRFTEAQAAEVRAGAHAVLLILADLMLAQDPAGAPRRDRVRAALRLLARAGAAGPATRACAERRARCLEELGEHEAAGRERARAAALPTDGELDALLRGQQHYRADRLAQAEREFKGVLAARPGHFWAHGFLALCDLRAQNWERAWLNLTFCLKERPDFIWARLLRGYAHAEAGSLEEAGLDFRQAEQELARQPNAEAAYYLHVHRGLLRLRQDRLAEAAAELERAVRLRPGQYAARLNLARVYQRQGARFFPVASASALGLLPSPAGQAPLLAAPVLIHGREYRRAEAEEQRRQAVRLDPPAVVLADYHAERGRDLCRDGRYEQALAACGLALEKRPEYPLALGVRAQALLGLHRHREAARAFDRYLAAGGRPLPDVYRGRGQARMQLGDYLGAVDDYTRVLQREPGAEICAHRGWAYFFADAWKPALRDFDNALRADPEYGDAYTGRALARVMLGAYREAVADAKEARRRRPSTPEMMHNLACVFAQAVAKVLADGGEQRRQELARAYRAAALGAIRDALALVRPAEREAFWRQKVLPDTALDPIRASPEFRELVRELETVRGPGAAAPGESAHNPFGD